MKTVDRVLDLRAAATRDPCLSATRTSRQFQAPPRFRHPAIANVRSIVKTEESTDRFPPQLSLDEWPGEVVVGLGKRKRSLGEQVFRPRKGRGGLPRRQKARQLAS